jgi:phosphotransferase system  glucose/maltose/N-acetylglucosamine-specific IIC component
MWCRPNGSSSRSPFHNIRLPDALAFFGGTRFVPIVTTVVLGLVGLAGFREADQRHQDVVQAKRQQQSLAGAEDHRPKIAVAGIIVWLLHERFHNIRLPDALAFFGGTRFVPIVGWAECLSPSARS